MSDIPNRSPEEARAAAARARLTARSARCRPGSRRGRWRRTPSRAVDKGRPRADRLDSAKQNRRPCAGARRPRSACSSRASRSLACSPARMQRTATDSSKPRYRAPPEGTPNDPVQHPHAPANGKAAPKPQTPSRRPAPPRPRRSTRRSTARATSPTAPRSAIDANPLPILVGGLAVGALAGALIPRSKREIDLLAPRRQAIGRRRPAPCRSAKETGLAELARSGSARARSTIRPGSWSAAS